jgi:hypothetical protein
VKIVSFDEIYVYNCGINYHALVSKDSEEKPDELQLFDVDEYSLGSDVCKKEIEMGPKPPSNQINPEILG